MCKYKQIKVFLRGHGMFFFLNSYKLVAELLDNFLFTNMNIKYKLRDTLIKKKKNLNK